MSEDTWNVSDLLNTAKIYSGVSEEGLIDAGNAVSASPASMIRGIDAFLNDADELDRVSMGIMWDACGRLPTTEQVDSICMSREQLYMLTQRLIYILGGREKETLDNIAHVFGATSKQTGVLPVDFRGFLASILTQLKKEHLRRCSPPPPQPTAEDQDASEVDQGAWWSGSWLELVAGSFLRSVDDVALKLDDLITPDRPQEPDQGACPHPWDALVFRPAPVSRPARAGHHEAIATAPPQSPEEEAAVVLQVDGLPVQVALGDNWIQQRLIIRPGSSYIELVQSDSLDVKFSLGDIVRVLRKESRGLCVLQLEFEEGSLFMRFPAQHVDAVIGRITTDFRIPILEG
mmetsp:Transcript_5696/g.13134  ORF Transcript_5696/g.13134 Transcript_5696/m.13134 type:complete len:346 (+) Transcript_5696:76-1113(+)